MKLFFFAIISFSLFITSCSGSKKITNAVTKNDSTVTEIKVGNQTNEDSIKLINSVFDKIQKNTIDYSTFSAKVRVDYNAPNQKVPDMNAYIRMKKDSIIWINVEKSIIQIARILITKDSFFVMNKLENTYIKESINYLQSVAQIPFDLKTLQNLIVGNPVYFQKPITTYKQNEKTSTLLTVGDLFKNLITLQNDNFTILHSKLDDTNALRNRTCDLSYSDFESYNSSFFSKDRNITISEKTKLEINLKFKQYKFNEVQTYPFSIPKSYKQQ